MNVEDELKKLAASSLSDGVRLASKMAMDMAMKMKNDEFTQLNGPDSLMALSVMLDILASKT